MKNSDMMKKIWGSTCKEGKTVFKVWSPMAERILLRLYDKDGGEPFLEREMRLGERGGMGAGVPGEPPRDVL